MYQTFSPFSLSEKSVLWNDMKKHIPAQPVKVQVRSEKEYEEERLNLFVKYVRSGFRFDEEENSFLHQY